MSNNLKIISLIFIIILLLIVTFFTKKNRITIKYSIIWYGCIFILSLFVIFPNILVWLTKLFQVQVASNLLFALILGFLFTITISLTIIVSGQKEKIRILTQEISILKSSISKTKFKTKKNELF